ncbi:MAG TPA: hypothetical protein VM144_09415 [Aestuariivirga sp.]|nr:hypothetical protein [Aestuariivirga sp.]
MGKYEPLGEFLRSQRLERISMTFSEIERILKAKLPDSKKHRAWWSNNPNNNVMTREWLDAGYETESVDIASGKLVFRRNKKQNAGKGARLSIFGCMKDLFTLAPGYDPTSPTGEDWLKGDILGQGRK